MVSDKIFLTTLKTKGKKFEGHRRLAEGGKSQNYL